MSEDVLVAVIQYLETKPHNEVHKLITVLSQSEPVEEEEKKPKKK